MRRVEKSKGVNRRAALRSLAAGVGVAASASWVGNLLALAQAETEHAHLVSQADAWRPSALTPHQFETVGVLVELIIPTTDTPGAKTALVDRYIDAILGSAVPADREKFVSGLVWLDAQSLARFGRDVASGTPAQQRTLLVQVADAQTPEGLEFFTAIKGMTIAGYYTTEIGLRQELGDDGRLMLPAFEGCTHPEHQ
jgi:hypothetical protein